MTIAVKIGTAQRGVTGVGVLVGGALKEATEGWSRAGGTLKQFFGTLGVELSTYLALGRGNSAATVIVVSESVTATAADAVGAPVYAWTRTDGGAQPWTIISPAEATTEFSTACGQGQQFTATFICTVTDQAGRVLASDPVTADCANTYYGGGYVGNPSLPPGTVYP